jgi:DNA-directed RNA polymerase specialized sigma24 family protein
MVLDEAALSRLANDQSGELGLEQLIASEPTPDFAAQLAEECQVLLARLEDSELQSVAQWKMEGFTNEEIAAKLGCALRSVERKLKVIRSLWGEVKANP